MPQTITFGHRQLDTRSDLDTNAGPLSAPTHGDFARGQRQDIAPGRAQGDFATGMRTTRMLRITGDFATGMRTLPRTRTVGDFATGMRTNSAPAVIEALASPVSALPMAA
jgi:hypothetical protein